MPIKKLTLKAGVNRENTRYTNENGWYESEKIRFRQGTPEKIGGWQRISTNTFLGICRSLWNWVTLTGANLLGVGTSSRFYLESTGIYYDITPITTTIALGANSFATVNTTTTVTVTDIGYNPAVGDFVIYSGVTTFNGVTISGEYEVKTVPTNTTYTITSATTATGTGSGGGAVSFASYILHIGAATNVSFGGWGSNVWSSSNWGGVGYASTATLAIWSQWNFGQDLVFGPKQGKLYYWNATTAVALATPTTVTISNATPAVVTLTANTSTPIISSTAVMFQTTGALPLPLAPYTVYYATYVTATTFKLSSSYANYVAGTFINTTTAGSGTHSLSQRGIAVSDLAGASSVPIQQNIILVSDTSRFTFCFGANPYGSTTYDPMTIRWSNQESVVEWAPSATNQAGEIRLSHGSSVVSVLQSRQEILTWTDAAVYSLQYLGPPSVWGSQLLSDNISIASMNAASYASGVAYWMGQDKFYKYDGRVQTLRCDLRQYIYSDINRTQFDQVFSGTNEGFNEVWWFYCSEASTTIDKYVIYNYVEDLWYYGTMARTAWLDTALRNYPMAATYSNNLVYHEYGVDDNATGTTTAITASITSAQFDIDDGNNFAFVWRIIPDLTFRGSTDGTSPSMYIQLLPLQSSGSGYNDPKSVGGTDSTATQAITATQTYPIDVDKYTGQVNIRIRGRQMSIRVYSDTIGIQWQLGSPRIDIRMDGRR
jgi:hypothetical protein